MLWNDGHNIRLHSTSTYRTYCNNISSQKHLYSLFSNIIKVQLYSCYCSIVRWLIMGPQVAIYLNQQKTIIFTNEKDKSIWITKEKQKDCAYCEWNLQIYRYHWMMEQSNSLLLVSPNFQSHEPTIKTCRC